jgi:hypothetical protein
MPIDKVEYTPDEYMKCARKRRYVHLKSTHNVIEKAAKEGHNIQAYECPYCGYWHVGHLR